MALLMLPLAACSPELPGARGGSQASLAQVAKAAPAGQRQARPAPPKPERPFTVKSVMAVDRPLATGDYAWDPEGPRTGRLEIVADIQAQRLYVYRAGVEIGRASLIYGDDDKPTPYGVFPILQKNADHVSNIYDAEMPYMLRLTWDGIAIHASEVDDWSATNGCIGIPEEFAKLLFAEVKLGDKVMVTKGWMMDKYAD
jgi:lipoprotein-anchoring transpeptidase ErfK/SrfK